jgi:hypothetical protein
MTPTVTTLVLSPRYGSDSRTLRAAAVQAGWSVRRLGGWTPPEDLRGREVAVYGEPRFAEAIATGLGQALLDVPFDWLPRLPDHHRRRAVRLDTLGRARAARAPAFVKPADGRKGFPGRVYASGAALPGPDALPDATPVLVAEPVRWRVEIRCYVLEGAPVTLSPYARDGELALDEAGGWTAPARDLDAARDYLAGLLADPLVEVPPAVVVDVGRTDGRGWAVVEGNAAWGAGVYGCDGAAVLSVLARACRPRAGPDPEDERWAVPAP